MRVLIKISHPAHVHFYKYFIKEMTSKGHEIKVLTTPKKSAIDLLKHYDFSYDTYQLDGKIDFLKIREQLKLNFETLKIAKKFNADILTAIGGTSIAHASRFLKSKSIIFADSERADLQNKITYPFADRIYTPDCYRDNIGSKQVRYPGYHELAYLHPNRFTPNSNVLDYLDATKDEKIIILRFIAWKAVHDVGQYGFSLEQKRTLVNELSEYGTVYITSESKLPDEFEEYRLTIPIHQIHDLLYYADLYMGDSQTMATEAAVLGTPSIRSNSFAGKNDMGNFIELQDRYGLMYSTPFADQAIKKALKWIRDPMLKKKWNKKREKLLSDKIDVSKFLIDTILKEGSP